MNWKIQIYFLAVITQNTRLLVKTLRGSHGALDVERANVLPVLLEQRHQEVDGQMNVLDQLILGHVDVANGDVQAEDLEFKIKKDY